jgi:hypothetical protein
MITNAAIYTCDICKRREVISTEDGSSDGWQDFFLDDVNAWKYRNPAPSLLCPACARKVKLAIADIMEGARRGA